MSLSSFEYAGEARAALQAIMADPEYGAAAFSSAHVMTNLLRDYLPDAPRETGLLITAASAGLPDMLLSHVGQGLDIRTAVSLAAASLQGSTAFLPEACQWVTIELAIALDLTSGADWPAGARLEAPAGPAATALADQPAQDAATRVATTRAAAVATKNPAGAPGTPGAPGATVPEIPAPPVPKPDELRPDSPFALTSSGKHSVGWQGWTAADGGPGYVTLRRSALGGLKVVERYPLTDPGWAATWRALLRLEPAAADAVRTVLAERARGDRGIQARRKLDARSQPYLPEMVLLSGFVTDAYLPAGRPYDVRFLEDHIAVLACRGLRALVVIPFGDLLTIDVRSAAELAIGPRRGIKAIVYVRTAKSELYFADAQFGQQVLRAELARAGQAVPTMIASPGQVPAAQVPAAPPPAAAVGELERLAGLLANGLLTRDEFEHLKARLMKEG